MQGVEEFSAYYKKHFPNDVPKVTEHQHYVPKRYLRAWCTGKRIAVKVKARPPRLMGVRDVAEGSWFYEFTELNLAELETLINFVDLKDGYSHAMATKLFACSIVPQIAGRLATNRHDAEARLMLMALRSKGMYDESSDLVLGVRYLASMIRPDVADRGFELLRKEGGERILAGMENAAWPYLDKLINGRVGFMAKPTEAIHWVEYLYLQLFRTPRLREAIKEFAHNIGMCEKVALKISPYLVWIFAVQTVAKVMRTFAKFEFRLIRNVTSFNLITGDAPFVELADVADSNFLFPVSPKCAFYLGKREKGGFPCELCNLTEDVVRDLNIRLLKSCVCQAYAQKVNEFVGLDVGMARN